MIEFLLPLLEGLGASSGGLGGSAGLLNALGGGGALGNVAGTPLAGGAQGPTQGSGLFGALSGGGMNALYAPMAQKVPGMADDKEAVPAAYQFTQNRFRPTINR